MSDFYTDLQATAQDMLAEFGRNVVLRRINPGAYSASSHSFSGGSTVDQTVKAVFTAYKDHEIDGEIIQRGDRKVLIAGIQPMKDDILIDGVDKLTVVSVDTVKPGDIALLWKAQVRK